MHQRSPVAFSAETPGFLPSLCPQQQCQKHSGERFRPTGSNLQVYNYRIIYFFFKEVPGPSQGLHWQRSRSGMTSHCVLVWPRWKRGRLSDEGKKKFCMSRNFRHLCLENCCTVSKLFSPKSQSVSTTASLKMGFSGWVWECRAVRHWPHFQPGRALWGFL